MQPLPDTILRIDAAVLDAANSLVGRSSVLDLLFEILAAWLIYSVPFLLLGAWFWVRFAPGARQIVQQRIDLVLFALAGLVPWQVLSRLIKLVYFRERPAAAGENIREIFFHRPDESFPSDHAAFLFGLTTFAYLLGWRRVGHLALMAAILVSATRVITGTHWLSDIVGGLVVGIAGALLVWVLRVPLERYMIRPLVQWATKLGL